jgi:hypothetical protein
MSIIKVKEWIRLKKLNDAWTMLCLMSPKATVEDRRLVSSQIRDAIKQGHDITNVENAIHGRLDDYKKRNLPIDESRIQDEFKLI